MAQRARINIGQSRNQENMRLGLKNLVIAARPVAAKRTALEEIGNNTLVSRFLVPKKVGGDKLKPPLQKEKEEPVAATTSVKNKSTLKKSFSTSSIPKEVTSSSLVAVEDIDRDNKGDQFLIPEYVNDIYAHLRELERKYPIRKNYLEGQDVNSKMRAVLIDWLVEVQEQFHLLTETLYLTVAIIDRYLQRVRTTTRNYVQLVGVGAMLLASKYEETYPPEVGDFVYICDNAYTKDEIKQMEVAIIQTLDFSFSRPLPLHFLRRYSKAAHALPVHHVMAKYLMELCLVDYDVCHYAPSLISAAALYLALWLFDADKKGIWTKTLVHYTTYYYKDIEAVIKKVASVVLKASTSKTQAVTKKYSQSKFLKISCNPELNGAAFKKLAAS